MVNLQFGSSSHVCLQCLHILTLLLIKLHSIPVILNQGTMRAFPRILQQVALVPGGKRSILPLHPEDKQHPQLPPLHPLTKARHSQSTHCACTLRQTSTYDTMGLHFPIHLIPPASHVLPRLAGGAGDVCSSSWQCASYWWSSCSSRGHICPFKYRAGPRKGKRVEKTTHGGVKSCFYCPNLAPARF